MENKNQTAAYVHMNLEAAIRKALPGAMTKYCDNFDDQYWGWDICPTPGVLLRLGVDIDAPTRIKIVKYLIETWSERVKVSHIYAGPIPELEDKGVDFDFVEKLLKNWASFG